MTLSDGTIFEWGSTGRSHWQSVFTAALPKAFPHTVLWYSASTLSSTTTGAMGDITCGAYSANNTSIQLVADVHVRDGSAPIGCSYFVIGY